MESLKLRPCQPTYLQMASIQTRETLLTATTEQGSSTTLFLLISQLEDLYLPDRWLYPNVSSLVVAAIPVDGATTTGQ